MDNSNGKADEVIKVYKRPLWLNLFLDGFFLTFAVLFVMEAVKADSVGGRIVWSCLCALCLAVTLYYLLLWPEKIIVTCKLLIADHVKIKEGKRYRYVGRVSIPWARIKKLWCEVPDGWSRSTHGFLYHIVMMDGQEYLIERSSGYPEEMMEELRRYYSEFSRR
jgi:hypothetical protein